MGSDPQYIKYPDLTLARDVFNVSNPSSSQTVRQASLKKLQHAIKEYKMAPFYRHLAHPVEGILNNSGEGVPQHPHPSGTTKTQVLSNMLASRKTPQNIDFPWDEALYQSLVEDNKKDLEAFKKEEDDAEEAAGETEVLAARGKRAEFWARVGDKVRFGSKIWLEVLKKLITSCTIGQSYRISRRPPRENHLPRYQDRSGAGHDSDRNFLWRQGICQEAYRAGQRPHRGGR